MNVEVYFQTSQRGAKCKGCDQEIKPGHLVLLSATTLLREHYHYLCFRDTAIYDYSRNVGDLPEESRVEMILRYPAFPAEFDGRYYSPGLGAHFQKSNENEWQEVYVT